MSSNFNCSYMAMSSLTYIMGFSVRLFQPVYSVWEYYEIKITSKSFAQKFQLKWSLGGPLSKLCVTPPFSINFRCQIENQVSDYRLLGASSLGYLFIFTDIYFFCYQILTPMNKFKMVPEVVLLLSRLCTLLITSHHEQVQDYTRDYFTATKFGLPWTRSRIWQRLLYFYQTLTTMNKFKITSNVVLLQYPMHWSPSISWWWSLWHIYHGLRDF